MKTAMKYPYKTGASGASRLRFFFLLVILIIVTVIYFRMPRPCEKPLSYRIGTVDDRFGLSRQEFTDLVGKAASVWEKPFSRELFREEAKGAIEVNLIYDYRQEAADKLKNLSYRIDNTKSSYDDLRLRFENLKSEYEEKKAALVSDFNAYNARIGSFNAAINSVRQQQEAPEHVQKRLMMEKEELNTLRENLQIRQEEQKKMVDTINSMLVVINEIATNYNLDLVNYRDAGNKLGDEFCEGNYLSKKGKQTITIYKYDNSDRLVRVIAHEFGHALGLNHNDSPEALMYRLIQSDSPALTPADVTALKARCGGS